METERGFGITPVRFSSGDTLALRVARAPEPWAEVWHRPPGGGGWRIYREGGQRDGGTPGAGRVLRATVEASWTGGPRLRVRVEEVRLEWTLRLRTSATLRLMAAADPSSVLEAFPGEAPDPWIRPGRLFLVGDARAWIGEVALGSPPAGGAGLPRGRYPWRAAGILVEGTTVAAPGSVRAAEAAVS